MALNVPVNETGPGGRLVRTAVLLFCTATLLITCLQVIGHGYYPSDDALRHVAKIVSGKDWNEILVVRDEIKMDSHPGWHAILGFVYKFTNVSPTNLLNFSVISLFLLFVLPPAFLLRRPEAWIVALIAFALFSMTPIHRILYGRPFIFFMFLTLMFCFLWERVRDREKPYLELSFFLIIVALSTWIQGTWYLLSLPLVSLILARNWRVFILMAGATFCGVIIGAVLTGHPIVFLCQMVFHLSEVLGHHHFQHQLVTELRPFSGERMVVVFVAGLLLWRLARGDWTVKCVENPVFILGAIGWIMGFTVVRFWTDWGFPAIAFWAALEFQQVFEKYLPQYSFKRLVVTAVSCIVLFLAVTSDWGNRWSMSAMAEWPKMDEIEKVEGQQWYPEEGGILYSDNMRVFFNIFFNNPHGSWQYILGFESAWMPEKDLEIYRNIQLTRGKDESYIPWVKKMTQKDRMILVRTEEPKIDGLKWHETTPTVWSGRLISESNKN